MWDGPHRQYSLFEILPVPAEVVRPACRRALELAPENVPSGSAVIPLTPRAGRDVGATGQPAACRLRPLMSTSPGG